TSFHHPVNTAGCRLLLAALRKMFGEAGPELTNLSLFLLRNNLLLTREQKEYNDSAGLQNRCRPIRACLLDRFLFCGRVLVYVAQTTSNNSSARTLSYRAFGTKVQVPIKAHQQPI